MDKKSIAVLVVSLGFLYIVFMAIMGTSREKNNCFYPEGNNIVNERLLWTDCKMNTLFLFANQPTILHMDYKTKCGNIDNTATISYSPYYPEVAREKYVCIQNFNVRVVEKDRMTDRITVKCMNKKDKSTICSGLVELTITPNVR